MDNRTIDKLLKDARKLIGTKYEELDCSNFVHLAYKNAGLSYPYRNTRMFEMLKQYFKNIPVASAKPGDVILWTYHMGILDPEGCKIESTEECGRLANVARVLSSRSGKNRGVEYGRVSWFGNNPRYFTWIGK